MPAGDLVVVEGQIEVWRSDANRLLMGPQTDYYIEQINGMDNPSIRDADASNPSTHGDIAGTVDRFEHRMLSGEMFVYGTSRSNRMTKLNALDKLFTPARNNTALETLTIWPEGSRKMWVTGRPRGSGWNYTRALVHGRVVPAGWRFKAMDPRFYSPTLSSQAITAGVGVSSVSGTINNAGNIETDPIVEIQGPATNPRLANQQDGNRQLKIDIVLTASQTLIVDFKNRTATIAGVDNYRYVRTDNQWFELVAGNNLLTYVRSGSTTAASTVTVRWRTAWTSAS